MPNVCAPIVLGYDWIVRNRVILQIYGLSKQLTLGTKERENIPLANPSNINTADDLASANEKAVSVSQHWQGSI